ncbi:GNAT family N-acetyltransferase [Alkalihalobacterium elongatum]|uniref:GNAT family N-acetyltransferase n=1 Tax=Alkalihalobacterium elongatum TaxID=2675466 RepID=UPI001C1FBA97|nr:N-acetyltransferase [Alkalihalobacterium elongatum]
MLDKATAEEIEYILTKAAKSANEAMQGIGPISLVKAKSLMLSLLSSGAYYVVLRNEKGSLTGWALIGENIDYITEKKAGFIYELYILPEYRGAGFGKKLINETVKELERKGYDEVRLNVYSTNFAKKLYEKLGFTELQSIMNIKTNQI